MIGFSCDQNRYIPRTIIRHDGPFKRKKEMKMK